MENIEQNAEAVEAEQPFKFRDKLLEELWLEQQEAY